MNKGLSVSRMPACKRELDTWHYLCLAKVADKKDSV